jgi:cell division protein FtsI (penicillin-binding protein 3)
VAKPDDKFNCEKGLLRIGENTIREAGGKSYDELTFKEIIVKSSNIGSIKVAELLGRKRLYNYIRKFGFGSKTGIDLPGESSGMLQGYREWSPMSLPSISFGQEITATPVQLTAALSIIGNGGLYVKPHLVKEVVRNGKTIWKFKPPPARRVISNRAARETVDMMISAVREGTGHKAYIEGYELAGKTGTAQKYDVVEKQYSKDKHLASFMALFPAESPRYSILVIVDEPAGAGWGGHVAAPPAREIAIALSKIVGIPSSFDQKYSIDWNALEAKYLKGEVKVERRTGSTSLIERFLTGDFSELEG